MTTAMIVMEPGSDWPGHVGGSNNLVVFGRGTKDLLGRTQEKLGILHRGKQAVRVAVLACNTATGDEAVCRRAQLARTLLGPVASTTCGRLILMTSARASLQLLQELLTLAEALAQDLRGTTATVSVRFGQRPPQKRAHVPGLNGQLDIATPPGRLPSSRATQSTGRRNERPHEHVADHRHGPTCQHVAVPHGDHLDHFLSGNLYHPCDKHCDDHGPVQVRPAIRTPGS